MYKVTLTINGSLTDLDNVITQLDNKLLRVEIESADYAKDLHETQAKLKGLVERLGVETVEKMKLREIGEMVGVPHPQKVKHHIEQLKKRGLWR